MCVFLSVFKTAPSFPPHILETQGSVKFAGARLLDAVPFNLSCDENSKKVSLIHVIVAFNTPIALKLEEGGAG